MKFFLILFALFALSCTDKQGNDKQETAKKSESTKEDMVQESSNAGIVEENDRCVCTKEFRPVCGSNGVTYPNPCQAGCEGVEEFTEGSCQKK